MSTATSESNIEVGTVLESCWGYDQTNRDFYIVRRVSEHSVWLQEVGQHVTETAWARGTCTANVDDVRGPVFRRKLQCPENSGYRDQCVKVDEYRTAHVWNGQPLSWSADR
jgi:hypothetical protein